MKFKGDKTNSIRVGEVIGPGPDGFHRQVTSCTYDEETDLTHVEAEVVRMAPPGQDLRYYGSHDPDEGPPPVKERIPYSIEAR